MHGPFIKRFASEFRYAIAAALAVVAVAYAVIVGLVLAVPHLPLANKRTFYGLLRAQMAVDEGVRLPEVNRGMVLFLGSSVVERGVSELYMDSVFTRQQIPYETMNAGTGGFCAEANLPMFRAMLEQGLHPSRVIYGVGIQELNAYSTVHAFFETRDTSTVKLKAKTLWNIVQYGPTALAPLLNADHFHQYVFAANNAFRDVPNLNLFNRIMFGTNAPPHDTDYRFEKTYLNDLREIITICKSRNIPIAIYNAPLKPRTPSDVDIPYQHRGDSYNAVLLLARELHVPLWNFDHKGFFDVTEFQDNYHLTPIGARKISGMLADSIARWNGGVVSQDGLETLD
jgi:hypothetical protein